MWDESLLGYDLGEHPLDPVRVELTMALARELGVLDRPGVRLVVPPPADDAALTRVHRADYLDAVRAAPYDPFFSGYGIGTADNPVFERMHEASALIAGATLTAAEAVWRGEVRRAVNIAGGLHHAMPGRAAGFCVYNDPAVAIARLLDLGRRAGRLRRHRRAPRRRRPGDLLRRSAGADGQHPRDPAGALPGHRLPGRDRRTRRARQRGEPAPAARCRGRRPGCAPSTPSSPRCCAPSGRRS